MNHLGETRPINLLEIGTFVGVSTLIMAAKIDDGAVIHTIDPNFPLAVELCAMNTPACGADLTVRHQELALRVAQRLGVAQKIVFHAGGFSTAATFASTKNDANKTVPVIGPEVCEKHGPFDFIFVDGLHYANAVLSDLRLAYQYLKPGGRIVLHDVIGCWGSNVRQAVYQFLSETPGLVFEHGHYADIFDSIGVLKHFPPREDRQSVASRTDDPSGLFGHSEFMAHLNAIVYSLSSPKSVVSLGGDRGGLLLDLAHCGVQDLLHVGDTPPYVSKAHGTLPRMEAFAFEGVYVPSRRFDLCLCLGSGDEFEEQQLENLIESCIRCSDTIVFAATPPGELGIAGRGARPIGWWVRRFWRRGYRFHDMIRPSLEPLIYPYSYSPTYPVRSSELLNLYVIRREPAAGPEQGCLLEEVLVEKESRIEDLSLQAVFNGILLQDTLKRLKASENLVARSDALIKEIMQSEERLRRAAGWITRLRRRLGL
ncbi:MAG TPA: class I SAM-dependent methyltransferase [Nitrospira sp.]|nr:class I SAM-dependent methyltransferase [Nitrospira sp.]